MRPSRVCPAAKAPHMLIQARLAQRRCHHATLIFAHGQSLNLDFSLAFRKDNPRKEMRVRFFPGIVWPLRQGQAKTARSDVTLTGPLTGGSHRGADDARRGDVTHRGVQTSSYAVLPAASTGAFSPLGETLA